MLNEQRTGSALAGNSWLLWAEQSGAPPISNPASGLLAGADAAWDGVWLLRHTQLYKYVHISGFGGLGLQRSGP